MYQSSRYIALNPDLIGAPYAVTRTHFSYALLVTYHFSDIMFRIISTNQQKRRKIMAQKKVLVTGMSGLIGGLVRERIEGKCTLSALNRRPVEGIECHQADIADSGCHSPRF